MEAPPSRYRVVERGGRLVVIDTLIGGPPQTAADLLPGLASDDADYSPMPESRAEELPAPVASAPGFAAPAPVRPRAAGGLIATPPDFLQNVASTVCGDTRDGDGRLLLTTASWYDGKGPRMVALDALGERELATAVLVLLGAIVGGIFFAVVVGIIGWIAAFVAFAIARQMKPGVTRWLDQLSARTG